MATEVLYKGKSMTLEEEKICPNCGERVNIEKYIRDIQIHEEGEKDVVVKWECMNCGAEWELK